MRLSDEGLFGMAQRLSNRSVQELHDTGADADRRMNPRIRVGMALL
jgi:hypothetical protein